WPYVARRPGSSMVTSLSPDGKHLAVLTQHGDLALHDALTGHRLAELQRGVALALHQEVLHWLSDGRRLLAAHFCGPLKVWELSAPPPVQMVASGTVPAWPVATALAGGVVPGRGPAAVSWPALTQAALWQPVPAPEGVTGFAFSPDGRWLGLSMGTATVRLIHRGTGEIVTTLPGFSLHLRFSPDSRRLAGYGMTGAALWDVATGRELGNLGSREFNEM